MDVTTDSTQDGDACVSNVQYPEGFARITRGTETNIYLIQNMNLPGDYGVSFAFDLDDFDSKKNVGHPLVLQTGDAVEHLGAVMQYMAPASALWEIVVPVVREIPRNCGLLPAVRAVEHLRHLSEELTTELIQQTVALVLTDYYCRRAKLP
jgi:hypothetical protein